MKKEYYTLSKCGLHFYIFLSHYLFKYLSGGARGLMVIVAGNGHGDTSSNPGRD